MTRFSFESYYKHVFILLDYQVQNGLIKNIFILDRKLIVIVITVYCFW